MSSIVVICDHSRTRRASLVVLVESCHARARVVDEAAMPDDLWHMPPCSIVILALGPRLDQDSPTIRAIHALAANGFTVIAHGEHASDWPLSMRCRALLAGTSCVLDSESERFPEELGGRLERLLDAEARRRDDDAAVVGVMAALGVVGASTAMLSLFRWVIRVSKLSDLPTLITGETGTGKELLARAIRTLDPKRSRGPFVPLNCGAISPGLVESELFGHRRGAFTGAERDRKGLVRSAEGGVLFLDEIAELDLPAQTRLLRVLQERRVLGVGEDREVAVDVRVIAATNRDLGPMIAAGTFRLDLLHRLNVLTVHVPPLRERPADIKPLVEHFVDKYRMLHPAPVCIAPEFIEALKSIELPGNARQLENLVRQGLIAKDADAPLGLPHLTPDVWQRLLDADRPARTGAAHAVSAAGAALPDLHSMLDELVSNGWSLSRSLEYCERSLVESALRLAHGNQSRTARLLGITPRSVYKKLHRHGLRA